MAKMNYQRKHNRTLTSVFSEAGNPYASRNISAEVRELEADLRQHSSEALREALAGYRRALKALPPRSNNRSEMAFIAYLKQAEKLILAIQYQRGEIKA